MCQPIIASQNAGDAKGASARFVRVNGKRIGAACRVRCSQRVSGPTAFRRPLTMANGLSRAGSIHDTALCAIRHTGAHAVTVPSTRAAADAGRGEGAGCVRCACGVRFSLSDAVACALADTVTFAVGHSGGMRLPPGLGHALRLRIRIGGGLAYSVGMPPGSE